MAIRWTQEVEGGPRRVNHAAVSIRNRFIFSFGGYCTGEEYNQIVNIDVHVFDTGKFVEFEVNIARLWFIVEFSAWKIEIRTCVHFEDTKLVTSRYFFFKKTYRKCIVSNLSAWLILAVFVLLLRWIRLSISHMKSCIDSKISGVL